MDRYGGAVFMENHLGREANVKIRKDLSSMLFPFLPILASIFQSMPYR
jgi:hypothetical protein